VIFTPLAVNGAFLVAPELRTDFRGAFARTWCRDEFAAHGLNPALAQCSISQTHRRGTIRGMHYQAAPHAEAKLVRCLRGAIHDVIVDLRPGSSSYLHHAAVELTDRNRQALYVPEGVAHGFQALADDTEVLYQISTPFVPEAAAGVRWDDPLFGIEWPVLPPILLERDAGYPDYTARSA